jgi:hypothetical protein
MITAGSIPAGYRRVAQDHKVISNLSFEFEQGSIYGFPAAHFFLIKLMIRPSRL